MQVPDVSYARSGDVAIAYQVLGEGPRDLVLLPFLANIWSLWHLPGFAEFGHALALGRRLIVVNPRGVGLSDRPRGFTIDESQTAFEQLRIGAGASEADIVGVNFRTVMERSRTIEHLLATPGRTH